MPKDDNIVVALVILPSTNLSMMFICIISCGLTWEKDEDNESNDGSILTDRVNTQVHTGQNHTQYQPNQANCDHSLSSLEFIWKQKRDNLLIKPI